MQHRIPRRIYQTFSNVSALDDVLKANIRNIRRTNRGWKHVFFDNESCRRFIRDSYGQRILAHWEALNPQYGAARADLFRYLLMYKCGGVYLDIKSTTTMPLDSVLTYGDEFLLSHWDNGADGDHPGWGLHSELSFLGRGEYQQWFIVCTPKHPYLKCVIDSVLRNIAGYDRDTFGVGKDGVLRTTGPIAYTRAIYPVLERYGHTFVDSTKQLGLKYSVYRNYEAPMKDKIRRSLLRKSRVRRTLLGHYCDISAPVVLSDFPDMR